MNTSNRNLPLIVASPSHRNRRWHVPWESKRHPKIVYIQLRRQVEPRAITSLPLLCANHAELCFTATAHMVAAFSQLYHFPTIVTAFPALLFAEFEHSLCSFIVFAFTSSVPLHIAFLADLHLTFFTYANLAPSRFVLADVLWLYPDATAFPWTVETVFGSVFCELPVPENLEFDVKELVNVGQGYLFFCTAPWWHELWISGRQCEDTLET